MKFAIAVHGAPHTSQASASAYRFARALLDEGHELYRVFFYRDGVHNGSALAAPPQDEQDLTADWQTLARTHNVDLLVCIAAALRRGILNADEAERYAKPAANLAQGFELGGLGQLVDAAVHVDRLITFGA
ncbi:sulfurtransferase complex subunit TusD [Marinimicrobium alkaliphilum]|uniref:sulfurtransferase complex subunit TusD n=1 Tax=Marinimicrobium alkaliphilum TaxID=2202654 RepID=UPI000DB9EAB9|nr:sulfurtransferase complex subunit TusD [Marinimicrobium alkaliphilum]